MAQQPTCPILTPLKFEAQKLLLQSQKDTGIQSTEEEKNDLNVNQITDKNAKKNKNAGLSSLWQC